MKGLVGGSVGGRPGALPPPLNPALHLPPPLSDVRSVNDNILIENKRKETRTNW